MSTLGLSTLVRRIPAEIVDDVVAEFAKAAQRHGGRIAGYPLIATPGRVTITGDRATVQMRGVPAGFWTWREYGTKPHSVGPRTKKAMNHGLDHPVSGIIEGVYMPARRRWTAAVDDFEAGYGALVGAVVDRTWR